MWKNEVQKNLAIFIMLYNARNHNSSDYQWILNLVENAHECVNHEKSYGGKINYFSNNQTI